MKIDCTSVIKHDSGEFMKRIVLLASRLSMNKGTGKSGGSLSVLDRHTGFMTTEKVGGVPKEKRAKYCALSAEKATRLFRNNGTRTFDSVDESKEQYGGGVRIEDVCVGFSGFAPEVDEAISVAYAAYVNHTCQKGFHESLPKAFLNEVSQSMLYFEADNPMIDELAKALVA